jgi:hypothetical protein
MQPRLIQAGNIGLNLTMLVSWEWNPRTEFLVVRLLDDTLYVQGAQARGLWLLLDTLATVQMGGNGTGQA